jgi:ESS family glutamate:Na+ symporter
MEEKSDMGKWSTGLISLLFIGVLMLLGKLLKSKVPFLSKVVLPTALLGGLIGLLFSDVVLSGITLLGVIIFAVFIAIAILSNKYLKEKNRVPGLIITIVTTLIALAGLFFSAEIFQGALLSNLVLYNPYTIDTTVMEAIVYHALALGFISLSLKTSENKNKRKLWSTGMIITSTYALQGFIGVLLVMLFWSDKFIGSGILLALGFGQGPGLAISFGNMWTALLENNGGALGASYAFLGFLWGGIVGVFAINIISRKKGKAKPTTYTDESVSTTTIQIDTVKEVSVLDGLTVQLVVISIIYAAVWVTLFLLEKVLMPLGNIGGTIFNLFSGFNFILGILYALIYKIILKAIGKRKTDIKFITNNYLLSNISSTCFNVMICGSVLMITVEFISSFGLLLMVITTVGGIATLFYNRFICNKVYTQFKDEYFVAMYGMMTGVASTGIALLKGLDRNLETPVAEELVLGSGTAITMALPLFAILMLPQIGFGKPNEMLFNYLTLFGCLAYALTMIVILLVRSKRKPT